MKLLNSKSIIDCTEVEEEKHNEELFIILESLSIYPNYDCAALIKTFDKYNKDKNLIIKKCKLYNCDETIDYVDSKNGIDIALIDDYLTFIVYGQHYTINNKTYITKSEIQIRPYNKNKNFIKLHFSKI